MAFSATALQYFGKILSLTLTLLNFLIGNPKIYNYVPNSVHKGILNYVLQTQKMSDLLSLTYREPPPLEAVGILTAETVQPLCGHFRGSDLMILPPKCGYQSSQARHNGRHQFIYQSLNPASKTLVQRLSRRKNI